MAHNRTVAASLFVLAATVVFAVVLGFVLAFQPAKPESVEERWARLEVAEPEVVFLGDLTEAEQAAITRELRMVCSQQVAWRARCPSSVPSGAVGADTAVRGMAAPPCRSGSASAGDSGRTAPAITRAEAPLAADS